MKFSKIYAILTFCFLGSATISTQSVLEQYFGGNKDSLVKEATKLIHTPERSFKPTNQPTEPDPATIADMGFEQVYKSEIHQFSVGDKKNFCLQVSQSIPKYYYSNSRCNEQCVLI